MLEPNPTLYVKNLDWKIKKALLRRALYSLFTRHGKVLEIITPRRDGLRGQAFVVMNTVQSATAALQAEQGFTFFGKDMVIEYARQKSDRIAKRDGDYVPKSRRAKSNVDAPSTPQDTVTMEASDEAVAPIPPPPTDMDTVNGDATAAAAPTGTTEAPMATSPPSHILLAQNLPAECNEMMLGMLFRQYAGYKEIRMPRAGLAFVDFDSEAQATVAMTALNGFKLTPNDELNLSYGRTA
jgi:U2 small nuclear ribonucleoprotein B''